MFVYVHLHKLYLPMRIHTISLTEFTLAKKHPTWMDLLIVLKRKTRVRQGGY